jgi:hypothetical protein
MSHARGLLGARLADGVPPAHLAKWRRQIKAAIVTPAEPVANPGPELVAEMRRQRWAFKRRLRIQLRAAVKRRAKRLSRRGRAA